MVSVKPRSALLSRPFSPTALIRLTVAGLAISAAIALTMPWAANAQPVSGQSSEAGRGRYIVVLKDSVNHPGAVASVQADRVDADVSLVYHSALKGYAAILPRDEVDRLEGDPRVDYVVRDRKVKAFAQTVPTGIDRIGALENPSLDIDSTDDVRVNVDVAVIDTGVDYEHPDLDVEAWTNCVPISGDELAEECIDSTGTDGYGHGTHVAGTIGAIDNGFGVVGVAPGARIWSARVLNNEGWGWDAWIIAGVDWVTAHASQIEVANMSLGGFDQTEGPDPLDEAITASTEAGVVYAIAAGNNGVDAKAISPANNPDVITVSALADYDGKPGGEGEPTCGDYGEDEELAGFSNYGSDVEIAAPGVCIYSTVPGNKYAYSSGTSMATPHVAGAAAILASESNPNSKKDVEAIGQELADRGRFDWFDSARDGDEEPLAWVGPLVTAVGTKAASIEGPFTVTLNGVVNPGGLATHYRFEYGTSTSYGQSIPVSPKAVGSGTKNVNVSEALDGFQPGQVYHYRVVATNSEGTLYGQDRSFSTSRWNRVPMEGVGEVVAVSCSSPTACTAVAPGSLGLAKARRWDGSEWTSQEIAKPEGAAPFAPWLLEVSCPTDVFCMGVGKYFAEGGDNPLVETWDGTEWQVVPPPTAVQYTTLADVTCLSATSCTVVGIHGGGSTMLIEHWDGTEWSSQTPPNFKAAGYSNTSMKSISCSAANACMAVGWGEIGSNQVATTSMYWDGIDWEVQTTPSPAPVSEEESFFAGLEGVSCGSATDCVAAGAVTRNWLPDDEMIEGILAHWDGSDWTLAEDPPGTGLLDVSCSSETECFAVGGPAIERWDGEEWGPEGHETLDGAAPAYAMTGVSCTAPTCMAVGADDEGRPLAEMRELPLPVVSTLTATSVGTDQARLRGSVNPNGLETEYQFEYGKTTAYGTKVPVSAEAIGSGFSAIKVNRFLTGLEPSTTYHYRVVATNSAGTAEGEDREFQTTAGLTPKFVSDFGSTGAGDGQFWEPNGLAVDSSGNVWVADTKNNRIQKFNGKGEYQSKFGSSGSGNGQFSSPAGIAVDSSGNVWVADAGNNRIQKFNSSGEYLTKFGSSGSGNGQFSSPVGVSVDASGNVWVADTGNNRIQKFNSSGEYLTKFGSKGSGSGQFSQPRAIAIGAEGRLWVTDTGNYRVQQLTAAGEYLGQFGSQGSNDGQFQAVVGAALDAGSGLWALDLNGTLQRWTLVSNPDEPTAATEAATPVYSRAATLNGICNGESFDARCHFEYGTTPSYGSEAPVPAEGIGSGSNDVPVSRLISGLEDEATYHFRIVATGPGGTVVGEDQEFTTKPALPITGYEAATSVNRTDATLNAVVIPNGYTTSYHFEYGKTTAYGQNVPASPKGVGSGLTSVEVSEKATSLKAGTTYHYRVVATNSKGTTEGPDKQFTTRPLGSPVFSFNVEEAGSEELRSSIGVAVDSKGNAWIADTDNSRLVQLNSKGEYLQEAGEGYGSGAGQLSYPYGVAVGAEDHIFVTDTFNNRVQEFESDGDFVRQFGSTGTGTGKFDFPTGIAIGAEGHTLVVDTGNNRVQEFGSTGTFIRQFGTSGSGNGQFSTPRGIDADAAGNVWVVDSGNNRVQKFNASGEYQSQFGSSGSGNGQFSGASGIALDAKGNIWVADNSNCRIQQFSAAGAYLQQFGECGFGETTFDSMLEGPNLAIGPEGAIWLSDGGNNRVQKWTPGALAVDSDVNGDGRADLVALRANGVAYVHPAGTESKFGSGVSSFSGSPLDPAQYDGEGDYVIDTADVNGDVYSDLTTLTDEGDVRVYPGQSGSSFAAAVTSELELTPALLEAGGHEPIAVAEVNGDGYGDLVAYDDEGEAVMVYLGNPDYTFEDGIVARSSIASALHTGSGHYFIDVGDVTGDNRADLVTMTSGDDLDVFPGQANGTFATPIVSQGGGIDPAMDDGAGYEPVGLGDITGDGHADLGLVKSGTVYVYPGNYLGELGTPKSNFAGLFTSSTFNAANLAEMFGFYDVTGDGRADLVGANNKAVSVTTVPGKADGTFGSPVGTTGPFPSTQHFKNQTSSGNEFVLEKPSWRRRGCEAGGC